MVKNPPAIQETQIGSLSQKDSPGEGNSFPQQYSCLETPDGQRNLAGYSPWDPKELDMTELLTIHSTQSSFCPRWAV